MSKKSNSGLIYLMLAIAIAALVAWLWYKHSQALANPIAQLQASVRGTQSSALNFLTPAPISQDLIPIQSAPLS